MNSASLVIRLATELNRHRALTPEEEEMLCTAMRRTRPTSRTLWTAKEDRELLRLARKPGATSRTIAAKMGRTRAAVRSRYAKIRNRGKDRG